MMTWYPIQWSLEMSRKDPFLPFLEKVQKVIITNSNLKSLKHMEHLSISYILPSDDIHFSPLLYKIQGFQEKKTVKSTKMPNPMQFFTETTAVDTYTLCLTFFDIWGCVFWVLAKLWEVVWFCFIQTADWNQNMCCSYFHKSVGISKKVKIS